MTKENNNKSYLLTDSTKDDLKTARDNLFNLTKKEV